MHIYDTYSPHPPAALAEIGMLETVRFFEASNFVVLTVQRDLVTLALDRLSMTRVPGRLARLLDARGVALYPARNPIEKPCAWVEYDATTLNARLYVALNDRWLRGD